MKKWYLFYTKSTEHITLIGDLPDQIAIDREKLHQLGGEIAFPPLFAYVPWRHHVDIITKCKSIEEALFYIQKTIEEGWSRSTLDNCIRADYFHASGGALTNFSERLPAPQGDLLRNY